MAPERSSKRQKTASESQSNTTTASSTLPSQIPLPAEPPSPDLASSTNSSANPAPSSSWYASWSRKAPPIAKAARESLKSASDVAIDIASSIKDVPPKPRSIRSPSLAMTLGKGRASRASLADVATTMVHAEANSPSRRSTKSLSISSKDTREVQEAVTRTEERGKSPQGVTIPSEPPTQKIEPIANTQQDTQSQRSSWIGWLGRGDNVAGAAENPLPDSNPPLSVQEQPALQPEIQEVVSSGVPMENPTQETSSSKRGWFPIWQSENNTKSGTETPVPNGEEAIQSSAGVGSKKDGTQIAQDKKLELPSVELEVASKEESVPPVLPHDGSKASGWVFWSRERKANDSSISVSGPQEGEIAVSDTPSQSKPRKASISVPDAKMETKSETQPPEAQKAINTEKQAEKKPSKSGEASSATPLKKSDQQTIANATKAESSNATAIATEPVENKKPVSVTSGKFSNNLLLPTLYSTLKPVESPSLLIRLANMLYTPKEPDFSHLTLVKDPPRIKNALAIGVHGYFPTPLIRSVLGQPTGTSIKFADMAAKSIKKWTSGQGYECSVKSAALEGEGKIAERCELLWKLLLNWIEEIRKSDFIMVACHSQGVPVAIMLVARLIQFGCVNSARICICAMAGVNMGPFPEFKSRWIGGSAGELFEFSDPSSRVSVDYLSALDVVLKFGAHLTFIGSIDDQLVSLESSIYAPITHPHIFRAVSIDSRVHAPNFLSHLVGFALKLRNLGVQDHGLIRELSSPLAGSLYTGEGHSRIYEDDAVYDLAVSFALETNALSGLPLAKKATAASGNNPYILPFAMRGILEEDFVKNELQEEAADLLKEFDEWKPTSKVLKDVKFRLEGIRSQL